MDIRKEVEIARARLGDKAEYIYKGYVDLGLPSGTLWKSSNENGYYLYGRYVDSFGSSLPSKEQYDELKERCKWTWTILEGEKGYLLTGVNGNTIFFSAHGYRGDSSVLFYGECGSYLTSTSYNSNENYILHFTEDDIKIVPAIWRDSRHTWSRSVRLVK